MRTLKVFGDHVLRTFVLYCSISEYRRCKSFKLNAKDNASRGNPYRSLMIPENIVSSRIGSPLLLSYLNVVFLSGVVLYSAFISPVTAIQLSVIAYFARTRFASLPSISPKSLQMF